MSRLSEASAPQAPLPLTLLSPARDLEVARAALRGGADAIYVGAPAFGARAQAANSLSDIATICRECHRFGVAVHVALNTLLRDDELPQAQRLITALGECGADALIVQDPAVWLMEIPPGLELHASTQCALNTVARVRFYAALGAAQVVLPREFTFKEIAACHKACPHLKLEAFVAGALCVAQSGECFLSEQWFRRSANRGCCAQPCRLPFTLNKDGRELARGHLLSCRDNYAGAMLEELCASGVTCFKIEGRLKDAAYTLNLTAALSARLNELCAGSGGRFVRSSKGSTRLNFTPDPRRTFNRGFTTGLLDGSRAHLTEERVPGSLGQKAGWIVAWHREGALWCLTLSLEEGVSLCAGDGFICPARGGGLRAERARGNELWSRELPADLRVGDELWRNHDHAFLKALAGPEAAVRELRLKAVLGYHAASSEKPAYLEFTLLDECGARGRATCMLAPDEDAPALSAARARQILLKRADALWQRPELTLKVPAQVLRLKASALNELRRTAWQALLEESLKVCGTHAAADKQQTQPRRARFLLPRELPCWPEGDTVDPRLILNARAAEFYARCKARVAARVPHMLMRCAHCLIRRYAGCGTGGLMLECAAPDGRKRRLYLQCHRALCRMEVREAAMQDDTMQDATMKGSARARRRDPAERLRRGSERSR